MHTSSGVDNVDEFLETVSTQGGRYTYRHGSQDLPVTVRTIAVPYRSDSGMARRTFTVYSTRHGPVVRKQRDQWESVTLMQNPVSALSLSSSRTTTTDYAP